MSAGVSEPKTRAETRAIRYGAERSRRARGTRGEGQIKDIKKNIKRREARELSERDHETSEGMIRTRRGRT